VYAGRSSFHRLIRERNYLRPALAVVEAGITVSSSGRKIWPIGCGELLAIVRAETEGLAPDKLSIYSFGTWWI
jgi:hypothetical protein